MKIILLIIGIIVLIIGILSLSWAITNFMTYHHVVDASSDQYRRWKEQSKYYFIIGIVISCLAFVCFWGASLFE